MPTSADQDHLAQGEIEETGSVFWGLLKWLRDELADGIRSWFGAPETRHSQDVGLDVAFHAAQMANGMRNLSEKALTVNTWATGPSSALLKLGGAKLAAEAGTVLDPFDPPTSLINQVNGVINRHMDQFPRSAQDYDTVVVRPDGDSFQLDSSAALDIDGDGQSEILGGPSAGEYVLGADLNNDGTIDPFTEYVSEGLGGLDYRSAEDALASLDSNGDGRIDSSDSMFGDLYLVGSPAIGTLPVTISISAAGITAILLDSATKEAGDALGALGSVLGTSYDTQGIAASLATAGLGLSTEEFEGVIFSTADGQTLAGANGKDLLYALHRNVTLLGGSGGDAFVSTEPDTRILGGVGIDTAIFLTSAPVSFNAAASGVEVVIGGAGADVLRAGGPNGVVLDGERGNDRLVGGDGDDVFVGGPGDDKIIGGLGSDVAAYRGLRSDFQITAVAGGWQIRDLSIANGNEGRDTLSGVEAARFADGVVWLNGSSATLITTAASPPPGEAPLVFDDTLVTLSSRMVFSPVDLIGNDADPEPGSLTLVSVRALQGTLGLKANGDYRLDAPSDGDCEAALVYRVADANGNVSAGKATVMFRPAPTDDLFDASWHLVSDNVRAVWPDYDGSGIHVAINEALDFPTLHPDIATAYLGNLPSTGTAAHGIAVASVLASGQNDGGTVGVAPGARYSKWHMEGDFFTEDHEFYRLWQTDPYGDADIVNNSWTYPAFSRGSFFSDYTLQHAGLVDFASDGRNGRGGISIFSSPNTDDVSTDRLDYQYLHTARQAIAVSMLDPQGQNAGGAPGAALFISASGADIPTADLQGEGGYANAASELGADHAVVSGTSLASPIVSGVVAMMLEANPRLGYRDVQAILAYSARLTDRDDGTWITNGAADSNGGGLHWSEDYGFGRIDARAAVRLAESWNRTSTEANLRERFLPDDGAIRYVPPDGMRADNRVFDPANHPDGGEIVVEHVEVTLHGITERAFDGTLFDTTPTTSKSAFMLRSPSGTMVTLSERATIPESALMPHDWVFTATAFRGERAAGTWSLISYNYESGIYGSSFDVDWSLNLLGRPDNGNDLYVYTDEYGGIDTLADPGRIRLVDKGGTDTINAAALTDPVNIDLLGDIRSYIGSRQLVLGARTVIENAIAGDADDILIGNTVRNELTGGRGDDMLDGRAGNDVLHGNEGDDLLAGRADRDRLFGDGGDDRLFGGTDNDRLNGGDGNDLLDGGTGNDILLGSDGRDRLLGGDGRDQLFGGADNDRLIGGGGGDIINGGGGRDVLVGGGGADAFIFGPGRDVARITDFTDNIDMIDLTAFGFASVAEARSYAANINGNVVFSFATGDRLIVEDTIKSQLTEIDILV